MRLDDDKIGRMGLWTPPTDENRAIRKVEAPNLSNDGAIWVTSPWEPSYLGYIGLFVSQLFEHRSRLFRKHPHGGFIEMVFPIPDFSLPKK